MTAAKGFFKDVGISLNPSNGFQYTSADDILPSMQRGDHQVTTFPDIGYESTLSTFGQNIPPVMMYSTYVGYGILAAPDTHDKTVTDYMKQGMPFAQAAKKAIAPLAGKTVYISPSAETQPPYAGIMLQYDNLTLKDVSAKYLIDNKMVELSAVPGRLEYAIPYGGPFFAQLVQEGYKPLITVNDILKYDAQSKEAKLESEYVGDASIVAQRSLLNSNPDTIQRLVSAIYRTVAYLQDPKTQRDGWRIVAQVINATQGTKLTLGNMKTLYSSVDPLFNWSDQKNLWINSSSPYYIPTAVRAQVQSLIATKTLPPGTYDTQKWLAAATVYKTMVRERTEAKRLLAKDAGAKGHQGALVAQARKYYSWFDFLDAVKVLKTVRGS